MGKRFLLALCLILALPLLAQGPEPRLLPGEGLAVMDPDRTVRLYGEATKEAPMGSLAKLAWLRLEGDEWAALDPSFKCTGQMGPHHCWLAKGHGKVNLAKATQESCNLAYLAWAMEAADRWKRHYGEGAARTRLEEVFRPFLGNRLPPGETLPEMTPAWVGDGELLRTSPAAMLEWLMDPGQDVMLVQVKRLMLSFLTVEFKTDPWWMKTGTAPVFSDPEATSAWVVGSNGRTIAVLHLPRGRGKAEGLARFRALMGLSPK